MNMNNTVSMFTCKQILNFCESKVGKKLSKKDYEYIEHLIKLEEDKL